MNQNLFSIQISGSIVFMAPPKSHKKPYCIYFLSRDVGAFLSLSLIHTTTYQLNVFDLFKNEVLLLWVKPLYNHPPPPTSDPYYPKHTLKPSVTIYANCIANTLPAPRNLPVALTTFIRNHWLCSLRHIYICWT